MNLNKRIIHGHTDLVLIPEEKYRVSYGIHQGIYTYKGQYTKEDSEFWDGASSFINDETKKEFCYYGSTSPYEFSAIVHSI